MSRVSKGLLLALISVISSLAIWATLGLTTIKQNYDGPYYAVVAKTLYVKEDIGRQFAFPLPQEYYAAHFPLYPLLMRGLSGLTRINYLDSGLIINLLATGGVAIAI